MMTEIEPDSSCIVTWRDLQSLRSLSMALVDISLFIVNASSIIIIQNRKTLDSISAETSLRIE